MSDVDLNVSNFCYVFYGNKSKGSVFKKKMSSSYNKVVINIIFLSTIYMTIKLV